MYKTNLVDRLTEKQKDIIKISLIGFFSSLMILMILYVIFAQIFINYIEGNISEQLNLSLIIIIMFSISLFSTIFVSYLIGSEDVKKSSIYKTSLLSYIFTIFTLIVLSYLALFLYYPNVFNGLYGFDYVLVAPLMLVYFTLYILPQFFWIYILEVIFYFLYFIIILNIFYEEKKKEKPKKRLARYM